MNPQNPRTIARVFGWLMVITFVTSIPAKLIYDSILNEPGYMAGAGSNTSLLIAAFLEVLLIAANIGTAVVLFPLLRRQYEGAALGFVTARIVESVFIAVGILSVLAIVTLRQDPSGADAASLSAVGASLVAIHDWTFLLGPGVTVGVGNGLLLGYLMYRTGLVPRRFAMLGLIGGPLLIASGIGVFFGAFDAGAAPQVIATAPEFVWELGLGIYLIVKGFRPSPILAMDGTVRVPESPSATREGV
jgi:uncharacterized protein DUF4386